MTSPKDEHASAIAAAVAAKVDPVEHGPSIRIPAGARKLIVDALQLLAGEAVSTHDERLEATMLIDLIGDAAVEAAPSELHGALQRTVCMLSVLVRYAELGDFRRDVRGILAIVMPIVADPPRLGDDRRRAYEALRRYGGHQDHCLYRRRQGPCTCGWDLILEDVLALRTITIDAEQIPTRDELLRSLRKPSDSCGHLGVSLGERCPNCGDLSDGTSVEERQALHERIVDSFLTAHVKEPVQ